MATKKPAAKPGQKPDRAITTTKVPRELARRMAVIAKLSGCPVDQAWQSVTWGVVEEAFSKALAAAEQTVRG